MSGCGDRVTRGRCGRCLGAHSGQGLGGGHVGAGCTGGTGRGGWCGVGVAVLWLVGAGELSRCTKGGTSDAGPGGAIAVWPVSGTRWTPGFGAGPGGGYSGGCRPLGPIRAGGKGTLPDTHLPPSLSPGADPAPRLPSPGFAMASQPQPLRPAVPCASATGTRLVAGSPETGLCPRREGGLLVRLALGKPPAEVPGWCPGSVPGLARPRCSADPAFLSQATLAPSRLSGPNPGCCPSQPCLPSPPCRSHRLGRGAQSCPPPRR